jgi:lysozyme
MAGRRTVGACACLAAVLVLLGAASAAAKRVSGIDVSRFQEQIAWQAVAGDGIEFAFVQASRGSGDDCTVRPNHCGLDPTFDANYLAAKGVGIRVGPYHRAFVGGGGRKQVRADARAEARLFIASVGQLREGDLRPALDVETPFADLSPAELRIWTRTWLRRVRRQFDTRPIIYTNASSWRALGNPTSFSHHGHRLWVANWNVAAPLVPADDWAGRSWKVWQHSSDGRVAGIDGPVDLNWLRGGWRGASVH